MRIRGRGLFVITGVITGALGLALGVPAGAGTLYHWRTEDGTYAYADDLKRVPERYRAQVETRQTASIGSYGRFTPTDGAATDAYARGLDAQIARLRDVNAAGALPAVSAGPPSGAAADGRRIEVRLGSDGEPVIYVPSSASTGEAEPPIVIEKIRMLPDGANRTRTNTIVRQGDRVLTIVRPTSPQTQPRFARESELE